MSWKVIVNINGKKEKSLVLDQNEDITIGRTKGNIVIPEDKLSRTHANIIYENNKLIFKDLNSSNGSFINGKKINKIEITQNTEINLGKSNVLLKIQKEDKQKKQTLSKTYYYLENELTYFNQFFKLIAVITLLFIIYKLGFDLIMRLMYIGTKGDEALWSVISRLNIYHLALFSNLSLSDIFLPIILIIIIPLMLLKLKISKWLTAKFKLFFIISIILFLTNIIILDNIIGSIAPKTKKAFNLLTQIDTKSDLKIQRKQLQKIAKLLPNSNIVKILNYSINSKIILSDIQYILSIHKPYIWKKKSLSKYINKLEKGYQSIKDVKRTNITNISFKPMLMDTFKTLIKFYNKFDKKQAKLTYNKAQSFFKDFPKIEKIIN